MVLLQTNVTMVIFICILAVVIPFLLYYLSKAKKEHPKGLIAAALSNMGERFGYYIMNAIHLLGVLLWHLRAESGGRYHRRPHTKLQPYHPMGLDYHGHWLCRHGYPAVQPGC